MKKIFVYCIAVLYSLSAQAQTKFLWYTGHWSKTQKNVFITDAVTDSTENGVMKMPAGNTVTIAKDGSVTIGGSGVDDWNKKIDAGEKNLEKTENQMTSPGNETSEWAYHFNEVALPLLDTLKANWTANKVDKKQDILSPKDNQNSEANPEENNLQAFGNNVADWCKTTQPKYQAIIDFYHAHYHDKDADYNNPAPPEMEYQCAACDTDAAKEYDKTCRNYVDNFFKPESGFIKDGLDILKHLVFLGKASDLDGQFNPLNNSAMEDKVQPLFSKSGPCYYLYQEDMGKVVQWLVSRCLWRAEKLLRDNRKNYKAVQPVVETYLEAAKQNELLGNQVEINGNNDLAEIVYNAYEHYYLALTEKHDWSQLANIPTIFMLANQYGLLTSNSVDNGDLVPQIMKILNGFELNIEMDVKAGKDGGYILSHLKGKAKITPEFRYGPDSCYLWVVAEDNADASGQPVKKADQKIELNLLDNEFIAPQNAPHYTGTKKYYTMLSNLKMDYCHPGKDTILIGSFIPEPNPSAGTWIYPNTAQPMPLGIFQMEHYFQDINKMKELAQSGAAQQQANEIKEQSEKIAAQMKELAGQMGGKRDASQISNYQKMLSMGNQIKQLTANANIAPMIYIDFPLQIQNNGATLVNKRYDAKEINPDLAPAIEHGYFTVDVEYKTQH